MDVERGLCAILVALISEDRHDRCSRVADALRNIQFVGDIITQSALASYQQSMAGKIAYRSERSLLDGAYCSTHGIHCLAHSAH